MITRRAAAALLLFLGTAGLGGAARQGPATSPKPATEGAKPAAGAGANAAEGPLPASTSITATADGVLLDATRHMVFFYVLHNSSSRDYEIPGGSSTRLVAILAGAAKASHELSAREMRLRYPIVVYPHQVQIITLHDLIHTYEVNDHLKMNPTPAEYAKYEVTAKAAVRKAWPELSGFRLDDLRAGQSITLQRPF